jgi:hypothetical protein
MRGFVGPMATLSLAVACGCTDAQLRITTVTQGATLADLQYQMVLRNLAAFAEDPSALPWHMSITAGTAQVADAATGHATPLAAFAPVRSNRFFQFGTGGSASRTVVQQWSTNPIVHTDALRLLQMAYRRAYGSPEMPDARLRDDLAQDIKKQVIATEDLRTETAMFFQAMFVKGGRSYDAVRRAVNTTVGEQSVVQPDGAPDPLDERKSPLAREVAREVNDIIEDLRDIKPGWFGVGRRRDVPREARYVAHEGKVYVWVCPEHLADLSALTLAVLDIATAVQEPQTLTLEGGGLNFSPGFTAPQ